MSLNGVPINIVGIFGQRILKTSVIAIVYGTINIELN